MGGDSMKGRESPDELEFKEITNLRGEA